LERPPSLFLALAESVFADGLEIQPADVGADDPVVVERTVLARVALETGFCQ